jgi:hypothetical protein
VLRSFAAVENVKVVDGGIAPVDGGKPAFVTVLLRSPYILTQAEGVADGVDRVEVSTDGGKTWREAAVKDFGEAVKGRVEALVRLKVKDVLRGLRITATVQNNPFALPYLSPGKNKVTVSVADPAALGDNRLVVTYAYRLGARDESYEQMYGEDKEIARAHNAHWEAATTFVQKEFGAKDLPATFEIDVPTPKDKYPVFPRMVSLRREVLAPGRKPTSPAGTKAVMRPGDELKTLPDPLATGLRPPAVTPSTKP